MALSHQQEIQLQTSYARTQQTINRTWPASQKQKRDFYARQISIIIKLILRWQEIVIHLRIGFKYIFELTRLYSY